MKLSGLTSARPPAFINWALPLFLVYYAMSNYSAIADEPRFVGPMFGSLAQFLLPWGAFVGVFVGFSPSAFGLDDLERTSRTRALRFKVIVLSSWWFTTAAFLSVFAFVFILRNMASGSSPQLTIPYFIYPLGAGAMAAMVGLLIGHLFQRLVRRASLGAVYLGSAAVASVAFFVFVFFGHWGRQGRLSLAVGARVLEPYESVNPRLIWLQIAVGAAAGVAAIMACAVMASRETRVRLGAIATVVLLLSSGTFAANAALSTAAYAPRPLSEGECLGGTTRICYWSDERPGARLLRGALNRGLPAVPTEFRPRRIATFGMESEAGKDSILVADMPRDSEQAAFYLGELVVRAAGCEGDEIGSNRTIVQLIQDIADASRGRRDPLETSRFAVLNACS